MSVSRTGVSLGVAAGSSIPGAGMAGDGAAGVWIITDGKAGDLAQCEGVASALGCTWQSRIVQPRLLWAMLAPRGPIDPRDERQAASSEATADGPLDGQFPRVAIATGRRTVPYLRRLKALHPATFTVFLKNPRIAPSFADMVWAPAHDQLSGGNVVSSLVGPHRFSPDRLRAERARQPALLDGLASPRCAVLLGGSNPSFQYRDAACRDFADKLHQLAATGYSFMVTPSRRTDAALLDATRSALAGHPHYIWEGTGNNPYPTMLAHGDVFIVTADSANMLSEPTATGRPIYYFAPADARPTRRFARMIAGLEQAGFIRPLTSPFENWTYEPQDTAALIATEIRRRGNIDLFQTDAQ